MCKEGWCVGLGSRGIVCVKVGGGGGGRRSKYLKMGWNRKEGKESKDFKKRSQAGSWGGSLKTEGWNPLVN